MATSFGLEEVERLLAEADQQVLGLAVVVDAWHNIDHAAKVGTATLSPRCIAPF
jgi:hypothetical protein